MEQEKDYSLLRPFDLDAAERGDAICYKKGAPATYISGPNRHGTVIMQLQDDQFAMSHTDRIRMAPLCWVEGRPVYKGDVLYFKDMQGAFQRFEVLRASDSDTLWANIGWMPSNELTWTPPKVKREGWVNIYQSQLEGIVAYVSFAYASKDSADDIAAPGRIACVRIEWEE